MPGGRSGVRGSHTSRTAFSGFSKVSQTSNKRSSPPWSKGYSWKQHFRQENHVWSPLSNLESSWAFCILLQNESRFVLKHCFSLLSAEQNEAAGRFALFILSSTNLLAAPSFPLSHSAGTTQPWLNPTVRLLPASTCTSERWCGKAQGSDVCWLSFYILHLHGQSSPRGVSSFPASKFSLEEDSIIQTHIFLPHEVWQSIRNDQTYLETKLNDWKSRVKKKFYGLIALHMW